MLGYAQRRELFAYAVMKLVDKKVKAGHTYKYKTVGVNAKEPEAGRALLKFLATPAAVADLVQQRRTADGLVCDHKQAVLAVATPGKGDITRQRATRTAVGDSDTEPNQRGGPDHANHRPSQQRQHDHRHSPTTNDHRPPKRVSL